MPHAYIRWFISGVATLIVALICSSWGTIWWQVSRLQASVDSMNMAISTMAVQNAVQAQRQTDLELRMSNMEQGNGQSQEQWRKHCAGQGRNCDGHE